MSDKNNALQEQAAIPELNSKQKKYLKGLAHALPVGVQIGKENLTAQVIEAIKIELERHELIKIKIGQNSGLDKHSASEQIPVATQSSFVQLIGKTVIVYKENKQLPKDKRIKLPR